MASLVSRLTGLLPTEADFQPAHMRFDRVRDFERTAQIWCVERNEDGILESRGAHDERRSLAGEREQAKAR